MFETMVPSNEDLSKYTSVAAQCRRVAGWLVRLLGVQRMQTWMVWFRAQLSQHFSDYVAIIIILPFWDHLPSIAPWFSNNVPSLSTILSKNGSNMFSSQLFPSRCSQGPLGHGRPGPGQAGSCEARLAPGGEDDFLTVRTEFSTNFLKYLPWIFETWMIYDD